jgi:peptidyl-tRNA hydrolase, PTH1 family
MFRRKPKPVLHPEWLIVGLGNPGPEYRGTRHNVGFEVIDLLAARHKLKLDGAKHQARIGTGEIRGTPVLLAKPLTYMNLSGRAVAALAREHGLKPERVLVIADDLDMAVGRTRLKTKGSAGGHNGHKSIIHSLGTQDYPRLKIGIGSEKGQTIDHVLGRFKPEERVDIDQAVARAADGVEEVLAAGLEPAMNVVNVGS